MSYEVVRVMREVRTTKLKDVKCDGCGEELEPAMPGQKDDEGLWSNLQPRDALQVKLIGGYGMYFDDVVQEPSDLLFCKKCADELCEQWPAIGRVIEEANDA